MQHMYDCQCTCLIGLHAVDCNLHAVDCMLWTESCKHSTVPCKHSNRTRSTQLGGHQHLPEPCACSILSAFFNVLTTTHDLCVTRYVGLARTVCLNPT
jgi:hypothetical protein